MQKMFDSEHTYIYADFIHQSLTGKKKYPLAAFAECPTENTSTYFIQKSLTGNTYLLNSENI